MALLSLLFFYGLFQQAVLGARDGPFVTTLQGKCRREFYNDVSADSFERWPADSSSLKNNKKNGVPEEEEHKFNLFPIVFFFRVQTTLFHFG